MPDSDSPSSPPQKLTILSRQHAKLYVEREHMVINVKRNILAGYKRKFGHQEHAFKKAEWEVGRLKREVELVRESANHGEVDYDRITRASRRNSIRGNRNSMMRRARSRWPTTDSTP